MGLDEMPVERPLQVLLILRLVGSVMSRRRLHFFPARAGCAFGFNRDVAHPLGDAECGFFHSCAVPVRILGSHGTLSVANSSARLAFLFVTASSTILGLNHRATLGLLPCPD